MTPAARVAAAIEILDDIGQGLAAEQALTRWARRSRFAGSKDRAAIRDHVFDVLRQRRLAAHLGNGQTGRALMIGLLRIAGVDPETVFTGEGHAPEPLADVERIAPGLTEEEGIVWNLPDWLIPLFKKSLGEKARHTAIALQTRAPICLRVNIGKADVKTARKALEEEGVETLINPLADTALSVREGARKLRNTASFQEGWVELQDASSQAVVSALPKGKRMLDYCAGGGGKALAMAARPDVTVFAHDADQRRMGDLPARADRAGKQIQAIETADLGRTDPFDVVLCDAPCSGSGAWRRAAEGKWTLTPERLAQLTALQDHILSQAQSFVAQGGTLAYATCSVLSVENEERVDAFLEANPEWRCVFQKRFEVDEAGDGFFTAHLTRD